MTGPVDRRPRPPAAPIRYLAVALVAFVVLVASCSTSSGGSRSSGSSPQQRPDSDTAGPTSTAAPAPAKPSPGCSSGGAQPAVLQEPRTIDVDGVQREYLLTLPDKPADQPLPLVLDFHGLAEGMQIHAQESQFGPLGQKEGFVVAQPNGTGTPVLWNTSTDMAANKDLRFVDSLLHTLAAEHCIDETRVYATGLSMGAFMTSTLACALSDKIAAVAPVAGVQMADSCDQSRTVPILAFHGTADPILYFNGGIGFDRLRGVLPGADQNADAATTTTAPPDVNGAGYPETVRKWAEKYGCKDEPTDTKEAEHVTLRHYDCPAGADVDFTIVDGGGHSWPGSEFDKAIATIVGPTNDEIDATQQIWQFFQRFQLKDPTGL